MTTPITIAYGDGIGPEIMTATLDVLKAAGADLSYEEIQIGKEVFEQGFSSGIKPEAWDTLRRTKVFLKAPITTPQGGGYKSLNVTIRKTLGLFANIRPCVAYAPFVATKHPEIDLVIVRENEEDLYGGIEHKQTHQATQALKLITAPGTEKICRHAFEYAKSNGRKKVTCMTKDNIMKISDGMFHQIFDEVAKDYPEIEAEHYIIDIGSARIADNPGLFDVIVTLNLYGDIVSDIAAEVAGSVGLAGSANIGEACAMFEAIHGSAPDIAGKDIANPSGLILGAVQMLNHIDQPKVASRIHNAWLTTLEQGIHTADIYTEANSKQKVGTKAFAAAVIENLGKKPTHFNAVDYKPRCIPCENILPITERMMQAKRELVGTDVFLCDTSDAESMATKLQAAAQDLFTLKVITNRGTKVWPNGLPETFCSDHWRCRFVANGDTDNKAVVALQQRIVEQGLDIIKTENLYTFDGKLGYSLAQGE
jgi:isocitrate dehydrogenase